MLTSKEILQIDATIIAGIFIFLTIINIGEISDGQTNNTDDSPIQNFEEFEKFWSNPKEWPGIGAAFALSAFLALLASFGEKNKEYTFWLPYILSVIFMGLGFVYLVTIFTIIRPSS